MGGAHCREATPSLLDYLHFVCQNFIRAKYFSCQNYENTLGKVKLACHSPFLWLCCLYVTFFFLSLPYFVLRIVLSEMCIKI